MEEIAILTGTNKEIFMYFMQNKLFNLHNLNKSCNFAKISNSVQLWQMLLIRSSYEA